MSDRNIMLDIETLGTSHNSVILSIGAVYFDPQNNELGDTFHMHIDPQSCIDRGLVMDPNTVMWWLEQSEEARTALAKANKVDLQVALTDLEDAFNWDGMKVWGNSASFDCGIVANAFRAVQRPTPWKFWNERCYRTLKNIMPEGIYKKCVVPAETAHDALSDAIAQAKTCMGLMRILKGK